MKPKICIVQSIYNEDITEKLCSSASKALTAWRIKHSIEKVPGAFEIPGMVKKILDNKKPDLIITLGVIIKGETNHFEQISEFVFNSL